MGPGHPCLDRRQQVTIRRGRVTEVAQEQIVVQDGSIRPAESGRLLSRLFGRNAGSSRPANTKTALDLPDIQGFILRGYRMPMVRHFLLTVGIPAEARKLLGRLVSGDESDAPQVTTAEDWHVGFAPGPGDNPADLPRRFHSSRSVHSQPEPRNARNWWAIQE